MRANWQLHKLEVKEKLEVQQAVARHVVRCNLQDKYPKQELDTYHAILVDMAFLNRKWESVTKDKFNTGKYPAHEDYASTIRSILCTKDKLKTLVREYEKNLSHLDEGIEEVQDEENLSEDDDQVDDHTSEENIDAIAKNLTTNKREQAQFPKEEANVQYKVGSKRRLPVHEINSVCFFSKSIKEIAIQ